MSKKLLGERQIGETVYEAGAIFSDEEAAATGLPVTDFANVTVEAAAAPVKETAAAPEDTDADVDVQSSTQTEIKQGVEQSSPAGSEANASDTSGEGGASASQTAETDETVEHVLTEQDLIDNPDLTTQGFKVGDTVRIPKPVDKQV